MSRRLISIVAIASLTGACFGTKDTSLFTDGGGSAAGTAANHNVGGSSQAQAGTDSGASSGSGGTESQGGTGGTAGVASDTSGGTGGGGAGADAGGSGGQGPFTPPVIDDCAMVEGAHTSELDGHCYRVDYRNLTFEGAQAACREAGGHLVTIGSKEENELVNSLHDGEHWIGATDGRSPTTPGVGTYEWVTGEAWTFSDWEKGQPNAYEVDCPKDSGGDDCFEHCAFQSAEGDWLDRSCWHTIVSVCEWDVPKKPTEPEEPEEPGAGGMGGADQLP